MCLLAWAVRWPSARALRGEYAGRARVRSNGGGHAGATCTTAVPPFAARLGTSAVPVATTVPSAPSTLAVSPAVGAACVPLFWHVTERPTVALAWDGCAVTERGAGGGAGLGRARVGSALHCGGLDWRVRHRTLSVFRFDQPPPPPKRSRLPTPCASPAPRRADVGGLHDNTPLTDVHGGRGDEAHVPEDS